ncbi:DEAD/DEAH box helicase, partial [bacterium]|nr:DEAD/DEAH box helicase [bacterium]
MTDSTNFQDFGLEADLFEAIEKKGFTEPTPIQKQSLKLALNSRTVNLVGKAQTGTGKTAAFGLPILQNLDSTQRGTKALIICPTRELAKQVAEELISLKGRKQLFVTTIYGGQGYEKQLRGLKQGDQIIVGTPGRVVDHIKKGTLKLADLEYLVLDEADEMLKMGFMDDLNLIFENTNELAQ